MTDTTFRDPSGKRPTPFIWFCPDTPAGNDNTPDRSHLGDEAMAKLILGAMLVSLKTKRNRKVLNDIANSLVDVIDDLARSPARRFTLARVQRTLALVNMALDRNETVRERLG